MNKLSYKKYLLLLLGLILLGAGPIAWWNYRVDPWGVYHKETRHGWNHVKITSGKQDRMIKAMQIRKFKPDGVLYGSSRVDWGLDELHPAVLARCERPYNVGMAGATMYEILRMMQHAQAINPQKFALIGLDIEAFTQKKMQWSFEEYRMASHPDGSRNWIPPWRDHARMLLTTYALKQSKTWVKESGRNTQWTREQLTRRGSDYFEIKDAAYYRDAYPFALMQMRRNLKNARLQDQYFDLHYGYFTQLLEFAHSKKIDLYLYVHPYHSSALDYLKKSDGMELFERRKELLRQANEEVAARHQAKPFPFEDFSGYHSMACEPLPSDTRKPMKWYFESSHFRKRLGDRILSALLEGEPFEATADTNP